jgi:hypothetical protein
MKAVLSRVSPAPSSLGGNGGRLAVAAARLICGEAISRVDFLSPGETAAWTQCFEGLESRRLLNMSCEHFKVLARGHGCRFLRLHVIRPASRTAEHQA